MLKPSNQIKETNDPSPSVAAPVAAASFLKFLFLDFHFLLI